MLDSHANLCLTHRLLGKDKIVKNGSGPTLRDWLAEFDRKSSSWRTRQGCLPLENHLGQPSQKFSVTWPHMGMMRNGRIYPAVTWERPICEFEYSFMLPTPTTKANQGCLSMMDRGQACRNLRMLTNGGRTLSPRSTEWMMGYQDGWTDLTDSQVSETQSAPTLLSGSEEEYVPPTINKEDL